MSGALDFYKILPKTNCGECGFPTCLAFALQLSQKNVKAENCPHLPFELISQLDDASLPEVKEVIAGVNDDIHLGGETVFYRHEKKFNNQPAICIAISDMDSQKTVNQKLQMKSIDRLAENLSTNMIALFNDSNEKEPFIQLVKYVHNKSSIPLCLFSEDFDCIEEALSIIQNNGIIIGFVRESTIEKAAGFTEKYSVTCVLSSDRGITGLSQLTAIAEKNGISDIILDCSGKSLQETLHNQILIRWNAIYEKNRALGYPIISFPNKFSKEENPREILAAGLFTIKYSSIIVLRENDLNPLVPLLVLRQNIFTDPQKPIQVDEGLYSFGIVDRNSPVFLTTNFSLTFFTVSNDIESCGIPSHLLVIDTEGTSVLTAYASDKISAEAISEAIKKAGLASEVEHNTLIIPGFLSPMSSDIEEATSWKVIVGPTDSAEISLFLKKHWRKN